MSMDGLNNRRDAMSPRTFVFRAAVICMALLIAKPFSFFVSSADVPHSTPDKNESAVAEQSLTVSDAPSQANAEMTLLRAARDAALKRRQQALNRQRSRLEGAQDTKSESLQTLRDYFRLGSIDIDQAKPHEAGGAQDFYEELTKRSGDHYLLAAAALLALEEAVENEKYPAAEKSIQQSFDKIKVYFPQRLARVVFKFQVRSGKLSDAIATFQKNRNAILMTEGGSGDAEVERRLVENLTKALAGEDRALAEKGRELLLEIAKEYPLGPLAVQAFDALKSQFPTELDLENALWPSTQAKRDVATAIFKRLGNKSVYRSFAMRVGALEHALNNDFLIQGGFPPDVRASLLADAEWFMDVREYQPASVILLALNAATEGGVPLSTPTDRIWFLLARCANSLNQPLLAAEQYHKVFVEFPKSALAKQARRNFILSLHYAKKHDQVVSEIAQLSKADPSLAKGMKWLKFWSYYLAWKRNPAHPMDYGRLAAREASEVMKLSHDQREVERYRYWLARILERTERRSESESMYTQIVQGSEFSPYRVFARWRKTQLRPAVIEPEDGSKVLGFAMRARPLPSGAGPRIPRHGVITPPKEDLQLEPEPCSMPPAVKHFVNAGLGDFARAILRSWNAASAKGGAAFDCAQVADAAEDYFLGSILAKRSIANQWLQTKGSFASRLLESYTAKRIEYPLAYREVVNAASEILNVEPSLVYGVIKAESHFKPMATSGVGARGLMQIMPQTGDRIARVIGYDDFHPDTLFRPEINIALGAWYLKRLKAYYQGDLVRIIAAYNAGPVAVDRWSEQSADLEIDEFAENIPFAQTYGYVRKVLGYMDTYELLDAGEGGEGLTFDFGPGLEPPLKNLEVF